MSMVAIRVITPIAGSPAARAGIRRGDDLAGGRRPKPIRVPVTGASTLQSACAVQVGTQAFVLTVAS